jgi:hypothetical protein
MREDYFEIDMLPAIIFAFGVVEPDGNPWAQLEKSNIDGVLG